MKVKRLPSHRRISMEAINYQNKSMLFFDCIQQINNLRQTNDFARFSVDLGNVIFKHTGMTIKVVVHEDAMDTPACATPALFDNNHPYVKLIRNSGAHGKAGADQRVAASLRFARTTTSMIDLNRGRVTGLLSLLINQLSLGQDLLIPAAHYQLSPEESAAVIVHEVGHLWSFFETLASATASNMVIETAAQALSEADDSKIRLQIITDAAAVFGAPVGSDTVAAAAEATDTGVAAALLLRLSQEGRTERLNLKSTDGEDAYKMRSIEYMADQFAVRHGAAVPLAQAVHTLAKWNIPDYSRGNASFLAIQAARYSMLGLVTAGAVSMGALGGVGIGFILSSATLQLAAQAKEGDIEADPTERLGRIKQDLIQLIKNKSLDAAVRKSILHDIEAVDALRAESKSHGGLVRFIYRNIVPSGRRAASVRDFQKGLEDMVNNDLFAIGHRLRG